MLYYTIGQADQVLVMLLAGVVLGVWYDLWQRISRPMEPGRILNAFLDIVCVLGVFIILLIALFVSGRLEIRLFSLMAAALGMFLYLFIVPPLLDDIVNIIKKGFGRLYKFHNLKKIFQFFCR